MTTWTTDQQASNELETRDGAAIEAATVIRWIPLVVPLLGVCQLLAVSFIEWAVLAGTH
jgi:hypothetical protein